MKELVLYYHIDNEILKIMKILLDQLEVELKEIKDEDIHQTMGYLLNVPGFNREKNGEEKAPTSSFVFFSGMGMEQLNLILDLFKNANIPYIPYKAMLTNDNINYRFYDLYKNVEKEYNAIVNQKR
jgi:hypothetical protein